MVTAAGTGGSTPAGTVASRQNAAISSAVAALTPVWTAGPAASPARTVDPALTRPAISATETSPSTAPSAIWPLRRPANSMPPLSPPPSGAASLRPVVRRPPREGRQDRTAA